MAEEKKDEFDCLPSIKELPGEFPLPTLKKSWEDYVDQVIDPAAEEVGQLIVEKKLLADAYYAGAIFAFAAIKATWKMDQNIAGVQFLWYSTEIDRWFHVAHGPLLRIVPPKKEET